ncbi:MAG TPA: branched-chain amino acid ABC transporter permease [Acidimicrobiia bacterium]
MLYTSYEADQAMLNTTTKRVSAFLFVMFLLAVPFFQMGTIGSGDSPTGSLPGPDFLAQTDWMKLLTTVMIFAIGALGLNILTGLAGQVSLGHAFFMGLGAYVAAVLGMPGGALWGLGLPIWIWLPMAGIVPALLGILIAPTAVRVRGLYLAIVTLGLVFIGEYLWRNLNFITGGSQSGRSHPAFELRLWKEEAPLIDFQSDGSWFGVLNLTEEAKTYLFMLAITLVFVVVAKNIQRTRVGRAFMSIRDRDIAAEIMGVNEYRYKTLAFAISSFFAGVSGALLASFVGRSIPEQWILFLSVQMIAIILIGGAGTVSGTLLGAAFVTLLPRLIRDATEWMQGVVTTGDSFLASIFDVVISTGTEDFGLINTSPGVAPGLGIDQLNLVIYGLLIIGFLIFEPLGLYGIWLKVRNYWKGWPFTY